VVPEPESVTCPRCGRTSYHPRDVVFEWCAACGQTHEDMRREDRWRPDVPKKDGEEER
jgi:ribosomal protein L37E